MCDPKRIGASAASRPARRPMMFPAASILTSSFAARMSPIAYSRAARSASLYARRVTPPCAVFPNSARAFSHSLSRTPFTRSRGCADSWSCSRRAGEMTGTARRPNAPSTPVNSVVNSRRFTLRPPALRSLHVTAQRGWRRCRHSRHRLPHCDSIPGEALSRPLATSWRTGVPKNATTQQSLSCGKEACMNRRMLLLLAALPAAIAAGPAFAPDESVFVKNLKPGQRETLLYVWTRDADHKESDFLAVVDVNPKSKSYGKVIATAP